MAMHAELRYYKIVIAYDGTHYFGWQVQKNKTSIAQTLEKTFMRVFGSSIRLFGVSRTDAGVHALGQVASFATALDLDVKTMRRAWGNSLPQDIIIRSLEIMPGRFNPHAHVTYKTYVYTLFVQIPLPFVARYGWHVKKLMDVAKLQQALHIFVGTHDFRSFSSGDDRGQDTIRTIHSIAVRYVKRLNAYIVIIKGPKFLKYMIRRMVGAAVAVATSDELAPEHVRELLIKKDPRHTLLNAPAKGLVLYKIRYTTDSGLNNVNELLSEENDQWLNNIE